MAQGNGTALARISEVTEYTRAQVELVKDTIARGASDDELMLFLMLAKRTGLDPFSKQIYLIERRTKEGDNWITKRQPQTGIDGLRLIADRTGNYAPGRQPSFEYDTDGRLFSATAYVCKYVRNEWREVAATAHYAEYVQTKRDGTPNQMWADKPHVMLAKCAEALALRRAFPAEMGGVYTGDEIRDSDPVIVHTTPAIAPAPQRAALPPAPARDVNDDEVSEPEPFGGKMSGRVENVDAAFNSKGELAVRFTCAGYTCLLLQASPEMAYLENGDPVVVKGALRMHKGAEVVRVETMYHTDNPDTWTQRAAVAGSDDEPEPVEAVDTGASFMPVADLPPHL